MALYPRECCWRVCVSVDSAGEQEGQPSRHDVHHSHVSSACCSYCSHDDVVWSSSRQPLSVSSHCHCHRQYLNHCQYLPTVTVAVSISTTVSTSPAVTVAVCIIICPIAIAYSIGQIIKSFCVCVCVRACVCVFVCGHSHGRISSSIFTKLDTDV